MPGGLQDCRDKCCGRSFPFRPRYVNVLNSGFRMIELSQQESHSVEPVFPRDCLSLKVRETFDVGKSFIDAGESGALCNHGCTTGNGPRWPRLSVFVAHAQRARVGREAFVVCKRDHVLRRLIHAALSHVNH